jgi:hypothetical protein
MARYGRLDVRVKSAHIGRPKIPAISSVPAASIQICHEATRNQHNKGGLSDQDKDGFQMVGISIWAPGLEHALVVVEDSAQSTC